MLSKRKGLRFSRMTQDYSMIKYMYYAYSNEVKFVFQFKEKDRVSKNQKIGVIIIEGKQEVLLSTYSGIIIEIFHIPNLQDSKTSNIPLFILESCSHKPKMTTNQAAKDQCQYCGEILWYYYNPKQIQYSVGQVLKMMELQDMGKDVLNDQNFNWKITKNQHFTKNTIIAQFEQKQVKLNFSGRASYFYKPKNQQILQLDLNTICLKVQKVICRHQKVIEQVCQFCLETMQEFSRFFLFQANNHFNKASTGRALQEEQQQYINELLKQKKLVMVLDLDNTILHSIQYNEIPEDQILSLDEFYLIPRQSFYEIKNKIIVKMRPYFKQFLQMAVKLFDIYVYTKGTRSYAEQICYCIKQQYKEILKDSNNFNFQKMITRDEDPNPEKKLIKNILPGRFDTTIILDDRRDVWEMTQKCIFVKEYFFFKNIENKWQIPEKRKDPYLMFVTQILVKMHKIYFLNLEANSAKKITASRCYIKARQSLLKHLKVKYLLFGEQTLQENNIFRRGKKLGIINCPEEQLPALVVRSNKLNEKHAQTIKQLSQVHKIPVISQTWLQHCYQYTYAFPHEKYELHEPLIEKVDSSSFKQILFETINQFL